MERVARLYSVLAGIGMFFGVSAACVGGEEAQMQILQLARSGRNAEAIESFEAMPDRDEADIAVLRAAAGCYWRERRFEEARGLYRRILDRQSNLNALGDSDQLSALLGRELPAADTADTMDSAVLKPEVPAAKSVEPPAGDGKSVQGAALAQELQAIKAQYQALEAERESQRQDADARIAALTAAAGERAGELDALRTQLAEAAATAAATAAESLEERREAESWTSELKVRIGSLEMEVQAANKSREALQAEAELKINDLLDAIETDKARQAEAEVQLQSATAALEAQKASAAETSAGLQRQIEEATAKLAEERRLAEEASVQQQLREADLRARVEQVMAAGEDAQLQVSSLEQTLEQLRGQLDAVTAQLAVRDLEMAQEVDRVDRASLELALDEVERLELEQAAGDAAVVRQQALLLERIETLQKQAEVSGESLAAVGRELEEERRARFDLEARSQEQAKALEETGAMLAEAKAALARQYDAIREQVQAGVTMRLEDGVTGGEEAEGKAETLVTLSPDLVPLIGQLEAATATAMADVKALREQLERERALFAAAAVEKDAELSVVRAEMVAMQQRVQAISEEASARAAEMEAAHASALVAMTEAHDLRIAGLKGELDGLRKAMEARDRAIGMLEEDLKAERDSTARVLDVARETEATLTARIRELEAAFALPDTESAAADARDGASLRDTVFGSILDMIPGDKAGAIARFEALPPTPDIPAPVLKAMGNLYRDEGNHAAARALFEKLVERNPGDLYAERKLVMTLFDMGLYDQALDRLTGPGVATPPEGE